jgi:hypothetical protein
MEVSKGALTVSGVEPVTVVPATAAVIVVVPTPVPVTTPAELTLAIAVLSDPQVVVEVTLPVFPPL